MIEDRKFDSTQTQEVHDSDATVAQRSSVAEEIRKLGLVCVDFPDEIPVVHRGDSNGTERQP